MGANNTRRNGTTLVEVLVALGIAVLIIAVIASTHFVLTRHASSQTEALNRNDQFTDTVREIRTSLHNLFLPANDPACAITLRNDEERLINFAFCRWQPAAGSFPGITNRLERVNYTIGERKGEPALLRYVTPVGIPEPEPVPQTNWIESAWADIRIELHDGNEWKSSWTTREGDDAPTVPRAARIHFMQADENGTLRPVQESMIIIPAGMSVTSTLSRASNAR